MAGLWLPYCAWSGLCCASGKVKNWCFRVVLTAAFGALAICAHVTLAFKGTGVRMLFLLVPAWAGLALVYYLYQKEFFLSAVAVGLSILGLWCVRFGGALTLESGLVFVGILAVIGSRCCG